MGIDNAINKLYMLKELKAEVNNDIKNNLNKMNIDQIEKFELIHKIDKLDLIIDGILVELEETEIKEKYDSIDKEEIVNIFNPKEERKKMNIGIISDSDTKKYIPKRLDVKEEESIKQEVTVNNDDEVKSSIEMAYKRIEDLEKIINERKLIEKEELFGNMKDVHSKEERDEMLKKRNIVSQSFTPKSKAQSDPEMDKTVAMSKDEFYQELSNSLGDEKKKDIKKKIDINHTVLMDKIDESAYSGTQEVKEEKEIEELKDDEYYDIYNEEKSGSIIDKFKDFLGK
ncbi:hypothetical protein [uncultured Clostridium sp.]|uniref:hypothetical protein n=1 Tax=uncultured Clostridium sp. TaxID=59620 RepID=UPI0026383EDE|nr:hypothetical protein [uncultured Clostridium sp.]